MDGLKEKIPGLFKKVFGRKRKLVPEF
jgi:hypothetical protein